MSLVLGTGPKYTWHSMNGIWSKPLPIATLFPNILEPHSFHTSMQPPYNTLVNLLVDISLWCCD